jgi:hypothetical protein
MTTEDVIALVFSGVSVGMAIMAAVYEHYMAVPLRKKLATAEAELKIARAELAKYRRKHDSRGRFTK